MQIDKIVLRVDNDLLDWQSNLVQWDNFSALVLGLKRLLVKTVYTSCCSRGGWEEAETEFVPKPKRRSFACIFCTEIGIY